VELDSAGNSDTIYVLGTATLDGGTVKIIPYPDYATGKAYTILTAEGGVLGDGFDGTSWGISSVFLSADLSYDANHVYLTLEEKQSFADAARTANQKAVANGIQSAGSGEVRTAIAFMKSEKDAQAAFDALSGEAHASTLAMLIDDSRLTREASQKRLSGLQDETGAWLQGFGGWGNVDGSGNTASLKRDTSGFMIGADTEVREGLRLGAFAGYQKKDMTIRQRASSTDVDSYSLGAYAGQRFDALSLKGGLSVDWHSIDTSRAVDLASISQSLAADYKAHTLQAWAEIAHRFEAGIARFEPFADIAYVKHSTSDFTERGGSAALQTANQSESRTYATLGLRSDARIGLGNMAAMLKGTFGWRHAFGDAAGIDMALVSGGNAFAISGAAIARDSLVMDAGLDLLITDNVALGLAYGGRFGSGLTDQNVSARFSVRF